MLCSLCWLRCVDPWPGCLCQQKLSSADAVTVRKLHFSWAPLAPGIWFYSSFENRLAGAVLPALGMGRQRLQGAPCTGRPSPALGEPWSWSLLWDWALVASLLGPGSLWDDLPWKSVLFWCSSSPDAGCHRSLAFHFASKILAQTIFMENFWPLFDAFTSMDWTCWERRELWIFSVQQRIFWGFRI